MNSAGAKIFGWSILGGALALATTVVVRARRGRMSLRGTKDEDDAERAKERWEARERRDAAFHKIWDLMHDPDPAALDIAEDLALENGIKLREFGRGGWFPTSSNMHGGFVLSPWGAADAATTRVGWQVVPFSQGDGEVGYQTEMTVMIDNAEVMPMHVVRTLDPVPREAEPRMSSRYAARREHQREQAQQYAVHDAWRVAKYVKRAAARDTPLAEIAKGIVNDIPTPVPKERLRRKELYGSMTRTKR